jgi:predicted DNA-binding transcriptional regulator AlpA
MKTVKGRTIYSITDLANALGITPNSLWAKIYRGQTFPRPTVINGESRYYSESEYQRLLKENGH